MKYAPLQTYNGPDIDLAGNVYKGSLARNQIDEAKQNREDREAKKEILGQYSQGDMSLEDASKAMLPYSQDPAGELQKRYQYMQEAPTRELQTKVLEGRIAGQSIQNRSQQMELRKRQLQGEVELSSSILSGMEAQVEGLSKDQLDSVLPQLIDKGIEKYKKEAQILGIDEGAIQKSAEEIKAHLDSGTVEERVKKLKDLAIVSKNQVIQGKMLNREDLTSEQANFVMSQMDPDFAKFMEDSDSGNTPAALQIAGNLGKLRRSANQAEEAGDMGAAEENWKAYNEIYQSAKLGEKGMQIGNEGIGVAPGLEEFLKRKEGARSEGEVVGKGEGEALLDYRDFEAALPGLEETAESLYMLADTATYTATGKARDAFLRQFNIDPGDAAAAKAKFEAVAKNDLFPQLKDLFGGNMATREIEMLLTTYGDSDLSPPEKKAQIQARVEGWEKEARKRSRRVGKEPMKTNFPKASGEIIEIESDEEYESLESGQAFMGPDGVKRKKP